MSSKARNWVLTLMAFITLSFGTLALGTAARAQDPNGGGGWGALFTGVLTPANDKTVSASAREFMVQYNRQCWPCLIFNQFAQNVFTKGEEISGKAQEPFTRIIGAVSVLFCLYYLGGGLIAGDASDIARRWTTVWKFLIGAALGTVFLNNAFENMWNWVYGPVMAVPIAVNNEFGGMSNNMLSQLGGVTNCSVNTVGGPSGSAAIMSGMEGIVCGGHQLSGAGMAYGWGLIMHTNGFWGTLTNVICGTILMAVFCWVAITFPLRFIDILIRLTIIGILSPVIIVLAVFKPTRSYVTTAVQNVLYTGCLFAFTGIMFNLGASVFSGVLKTALDGMAASDTDPLTTVSNGIILIGGGIVFSSMIKMAPSLAQEFSGFRGGSGGGVGDAIGGAVSSGTSLATKGVGAGFGIPFSAVKGAHARSQNAKAIGGQVAQALGKE